MSLLSAPEPVSVERVVTAPAEEIFDLLARPERHAEIDGSGSVTRSRSTGRRVALGDAFGMDMRIGLPYSTRNEVVEFEEGRRIAWRTLAGGPLGKLIGGRTWRYELEPVEGGTLVRETWDPRTEVPVSRPFVASRMRGHATRGMTKTLERLEEVLGRG